MLFLLKNQENLKKTHIFSFYSIFSTPILYQSSTDVLKIAFHIVFQVCFKLPEAETLEQAHSGVTRT